MKPKDKPSPELLAIRGVQELTGLRITNKRRKQLLANRGRNVAQPRAAMDYLQKFYRKAQGFSMKRLDKIARRLVERIDAVPAEYNKWKAEMDKEGVQMEPSDWPGRYEALVHYDFLRAVSAVLKDRCIPVPKEVSDVKPLDELTV